ncbi:unnamed protein product [Protopolystoma xenopodis]|uniref:Galactosyltransferase N-terminal domain-containing protein n=1 Tax=Protopolystoma xenopodis TaxID=117903 RepID=A0A448WNZ2_9PLAT|nr:unnamed protein product [Protopolystoma xenopodis]
MRPCTVPRLRLASLLLLLVTSSLLWLSLTHKSVFWNSALLPSHEGHHLAVIVPLRGRFDQLRVFVPHLSRFLINQSVSFTVYIVNQIDHYR